MTEGMKKAERHQKIKDPDFTKQYREALFGEMRTSFNRPASSDRLFSAYAPFTIYCRKLCELMIGEADKFCRKGKSKRTRIYFMGGLLSEAFRTALGCIHSMTVGNEKGAVSEWRSLYEKECTVIILHKNKKDLLDRFIKWRKYDYLHDPENTLQDERDEDQKEWGVGGSSVNYRHYGWIAPICEPNANIDRNLIEQLAGQSERKKEYQWSSEVSHSAHANGEQATKQMQKFICLELPKSLKNLVDIALEEIGHAERARSGDKTTTEAFRLLEQRTLETLDLALRFLPSVS